MDELTCQDTGRFFSLRMDALLFLLLAKSPLPHMGGILVPAVLAGTVECFVVTKPVAGGKSSEADVATRSFHHQAGKEPSLQVLLQV